MAADAHIPMPGDAKAARRQVFRAVAALATKQHGVVSLGQLVALGVAAPTARAWVSAGRLHRLHRGVYAVGHLALTANGHRFAAVLACGPGAVISHRSAAALHGIRPSASTRIDVTVPGSTGRTRSGIAVHSAAQLVVAEIEVVDVVPCTTVARTIVDLAGVLRFEALEFAIHRAQSKRLLDREAVAAVLAHTRGRRGVSSVRAILGISPRSEDELRSANERRLLRLIRAAGLPLPQGNVWIPLDAWPAGGVEVDFAWPAARLVAEVDTRDFHDSDRAFVNDRRRDRALLLAGWRVIRISDRDLAEHPGLIVAQIGALLDA